MRTIDLRSDTVTQPTPEMRRAMADAECGDDVFEEDPTVKRLEAMAARMLGKEAGLFTASGTMSNLLAVLSWCNRGDEIVVGSESHIVGNEVGGASAVGGVMVRTVPNDADGRMAPEDVRQAIRGDNIHFPRTALIALENTHNRCGGAVLTPDDTQAIVAVARSHGIPVHLDGARIFNAAVALGRPAAALTHDVDSVGFCLSKGLSAPIGSVLCGVEEFIRRARKARKLVGGGMRQVGVIAAAGIVALEQMVERLAEDHQTARRLAGGLAGLPGVRLDPSRVQTNIVIFEWTAGPAPDLIAALAARGVKCSFMGGAMVRMVTHAGITAGDIDEALAVVGSVARDAAATDSATAAAAI